MGNFYSWIRKGLVGQVSEVDNLGADAGEMKLRPTVQLTADFETISCKSDDAEPAHRYANKTVSLSGPGDVLSLNSNAIARVYPVDGTVNFSNNMFPYVEFWESDFAWRFTPARACNKNDVDTKLRPWLTIVACKSTECSVEKSSWNTDIVTFNVDADALYKEIFPSPKEVWKSAHVQCDDDNNQICRILGLKKPMEGKKAELMEDGLEYRAFLIPVFEVGRLRGIHGPDYDEANLKDISVQKPAWAESLEEQKDREFPLKFPSYFSWTFKVKGLSFAEKVKSLKCNDAKKSGIDVDVTTLGEGLDYDVLPQRPSRNCINMPAALTTIKAEPKPVFPNSNSDEKNVFDNLNSLLSKSPVFEENTKIKGDGNGHNVDKDDPWITPPIYGGKHALATSLKDEDNKESPWLRQVNLDLHYRAAAGLGKKAVQRNQEEFVNRAWQQIDAVKTMNAELNQKMLSVNVNDSVKYLNYKWAGANKTKITSKKEESELLSQMMMNMSSMRNTNFDGVSLSSILKKKGIPEVFVSDSFRRTAEKTLENTSYPEFMQSIAEQQVYMTLGTPKASTLTIDELKKFVNKNVVRYLGKHLLESTNLGRYFGVYPEEEVFACYAFWPTLGYVSNDEKRPMLFWAGENERSVLENYYWFRGNDETQSIENYINNKWNEISTVGYTCNGNTPTPGNLETKKIWNVFAMDGYVFRLLFRMNEQDNSNVVRVKTRVGWNYYIDRDRIENDQDNISFYSKKFKRDEYEKMDSLSSLLSNREYFVKLKNSNSNLSSDDKWKLCAYCVLYTPDRIVAKSSILDEMAKSNDYSFDNVSQLYERIIKNYVNQVQNQDDENVRLYTAWCKLKESIDGIVLTPDPKAPEYKGAIEDVLKLKGGLRDDSVYARLKECAATYYSTFFSDDNLIKDYLGDCLASKYPIKAYPIFPEPTYYYLRDIADEFILPGIDDLLDDSISMFKGNPAFIESFLCGMNTEMGRELLWREYPTDQRGSYFKKFWDSATTVEDIKKDNFFDVQSLHRWGRDLGNNHMVSNDGKSKGDLLFFAIKGDLMKLYPDTIITLEKAECKYIKNKSLEFRLDTNSKDVLKPVSQGFIRDDVYVVGFQITPNEALGRPPKNENKWEKCGYMLVFEKAIENIEFAWPTDKDVHEFDNSAAFADRFLDKTSRVGKHVSTLIGKN